MIPLLDIVALVVQSSDKAEPLCSFLLSSHAATLEPGHSCRPQESYFLSSLVGSLLQTKSDISTLHLELDEPTWVDLEIEAIVTGLHPGCLPDVAVVVVRLVHQYWLAHSIKAVAM
jgi:hypothetical protein